MCRIFWDAVCVEGQVFKDEGSWLLYFQEIVNFVRSCMHALSALSALNLHKTLQKTVPFAHCTMFHLYSLEMAAKFSGAISRYHSRQQTSQARSREGHSGVG